MHSITKLERKWRAGEGYPCVVQLGARNHITWFMFCTTKRSAPEEIKTVKTIHRIFFFLPKFSLKYMLSSDWWHNLSFSWKSIKRFFLTVRLSTMEPVIDIGPAAAGSSVLHIVINIVTRVLTQRGTFSNKNFSSLIQSVCRPLVFPVQALVSLILTEPMVACIC